MKKHELLEKAMRDYPAGTRFRSLYHGHELVSTGIFYVSDGEDNDSTAIRCVIDGIAMAVFCFGRKEWAEIIPAEKQFLKNIVGIKINGVDMPLNDTVKKPSLLSGKVAIQVSNEREFKLLMEHYETIGFKSHASFNTFRTTYNITSNHGETPTAVGYHDWFGHSKLSYWKEENYKIIPFADFAKEVGIEVPVFVMTSEDGVPIYVGDDYYVCAKNKTKGWYLHTVATLLPVKCMATKTMSSFKSPEIYKAFISVEAADRWIAEANKPKEVVLDYPTIVIKITSDGFSATSKIDTRRFMFESEDIIKIYKAHQSLQPF